MASYDEYLVKYLENERKFTQMISDIVTIYAIYDMFLTLLFSTTVGKKIFQLKTKVNRDNKILSTLLIISKTFTKAFSIIYIVPLLILGIHFLVTKSGNTLLDKLFFTTVS
ncbi:MAG: hypothetical protein ACK5LY_09305 [Lachnospirales bacterium]